MSVPMGGDRLPELRELSLDELSDYDVDAGFERFVEQSAGVPVDEAPAPVPPPPHPGPLGLWTRVALWGPSLLVLGIGLGKGLDREGQRALPPAAAPVAALAPQTGPTHGSPRAAKLALPAAAEPTNPGESETTPTDAPALEAEPSNETRHQADERVRPSATRVDTAERPAPAAKAEAQKVQAELELAARMRRALGKNPAEALELAREGQSRFPGGMFVKERLEHEVLALMRLGRESEAQRLGDAFLKRFPSGPQSDRVRRALNQAP